MSRTPSYRTVRQLRRDVLDLDAPSRLDPSSLLYPAVPDVGWCDSLLAGDLDRLELVTVPGVGVTGATLSALGTRQWPTGRRAGYPSMLAHLSFAGCEASGCSTLVLLEPGRRDGQWGPPLVQLAPVYGVPMAMTWAGLDEDSGTDRFIVLGSADGRAEGSSLWFVSHHPASDDSTPLRVTRVPGDERFNLAAPQDIVATDEVLYLVGFTSDRDGPSRLVLRAVDIQRRQVIADVALAPILGFAPDDDKVIVVVDVDQSNGRVYVGNSGTVVELDASLRPQRVFDFRAYPVRSTREEPGLRDLPVTPHIAAPGDSQDLRIDALARHFVVEAGRLYLYNWTDPVLLAVTGQPGASLWEIDIRGRCMVPRAAINAVTDGRIERAVPLPDVLGLTSSPDVTPDGAPFVGYTSVSWPLAGTHAAHGVSYAAGMGLVQRPSRRLGREASAAWAVDREVADLEHELEACRGQRLMLEREVRILREALRESD